MTDVGERLPVKSVPLSRLSPWQENPRTIRPERLEQLQRAMADDPGMLWARPLVARRDGTVMLGNQRLAAAVALGWETIPTLIVDLSDEQARMWALRDNNSYGEWDEPALAALLAELEVGGADLALAGFAGEEIDRILSGLPTVADPDDAPERPERPRSRPGEVYELGAHQLICGDATDPRVLAALMAGELAAALWADPPYGVNYVGKTRRALRVRNDDDCAPEVFARALGAIEPHLAGCAPFYFCVPSGPLGIEFRLGLRDRGWRLHQTLVWVKDRFVLGHGDHQLQHEEILYGWAPGEGRPGRGRHAGSRWYGGNAVGSVFFHNRPARSDLHPTMKPVGLIAAQLQHSCRRGDWVLDPFAGSGSTLIACEQTGRRCLAIELDPSYCDVIRDRYDVFVRGER